MQSLGPGLDLRYGYGTWTGIRIGSLTRLRSLEFWGLGLGFRV